MTSDNGVTVCTFLCVDEVILCSGAESRSEIIKEAQWGINLQKITTK